jgi:hypothetical protein
MEVQITQVHMLTATNQQKEVDIKYGLNFKIWH